MSMTRHYAHSLDDCPDTEWQPLAEHLTGVSELSAEFARPFESEQWGRMAGLWHDVGKFSEAFQSYLRGDAPSDLHRAEVAGRIDHSTAGAQHAVEQIEVLGHLLAYAIAGHHSGLLDSRRDGACLEARLKKQVAPWSHGLASLPTIHPPELPDFIRRSIGCRDAFGVAFWVRMLFSCLVDADFLDTERFLDEGRADTRPSWSADVLPVMSTALAKHVTALEQRAEDTLVNRQRRAVQAACLRAADLSPGLFSLTVPTGGGKTLSSLAFALRHAIRYGLRRVVYVIPFTSIIEQNAEVFRQAMAALVQDGLPDPVLEHHSALDFGRETVSSRLAAENWDAPLVVTTSVQFYESLFANRTSRCRRLHNLARSVVILDEAQALPVDFLEPCLRVLTELSANYGTTVLLCTATQPAVHRRDDFPIGLEHVREITSDPEHLYRSLRRVKFENLGEQEDVDLAKRLVEQPQALVIVNTRSHARKLFETLGDSPDHFHLSALMCPEHRSQVLRRIRLLLDQGDPCRVVSTQLIEAGVDIDFPVVLRSLAGLDGIAQAAGRCNRNGRLADGGRLYLFRSTHARSESFFRDTANSAAQVLDLYDDPLSLKAIDHYFRLYYWDQSGRWDSKQIIDEFHLHQDTKLPFGFQFEEVASRFRLIADTGRPVIIPWGPMGRDLCEQLRRGPPLPARDLLRRLQRLTVQIPQWSWDQHVNRSIELVHERFPLLISPEGHYSERVGLTLNDAQMTYFEV